MSATDASNSQALRDGQTYTDKLSDEQLTALHGDAPKPIEPETFTTGQVAELLQITKRHVQRMAKQGRIPKPVEFGASARWPRGVILERLEQGCPPPNDQFMVSVDLPDDFKG